MVYGILRLINFAHGDLLMVAAYAGVMGVGLFSWPWPVAFALTGLLGVLLERGANRLLLLDEPSLGLAPLLVREVFNILEHLRRRGVTILLVEQNAVAALKIAHYGYVLETGRLVLEGPGTELLSHPRLQDAYLGEETENKE